MSTVTATPDTSSWRTDRRRLERAALRIAVTSQVGPALWFVGILLVLWLGAVLVVLRVTGGVDLSIVQYGRQATTWFPFSMGVSVSLGLQTTLVAAGVTRRVLGRASLLAVLVMSVGYATLLMLVTLGERFVYGLNGWQQVVTDGAWFAVDIDDPLQVWVANLALTLGAQVSGLLVGAVYQKVGGWWGTIALPLTAGPTLLIHLVLGAGADTEWMTPGVRAAVTVGTTGVLALAYLLVVRRAVLRPVKS